MDLPLPQVAFNDSLTSYAVVAIAMVAITIFVLGKILPADHHPPLVTDMLLALSVLGGGTVLMLSLVLVFVTPDGTTAWTWVLLAFNFMMMAPAGLWFISLILFRDRRVDTSDPVWPVALALVTTGSEVLMGFLFALGAPTSPPPAAVVVASGLTSTWFFWSMASVMAALIVWAPLERVERESLIALAVATVLAPWVTAYPTLGGAAMAALMTLVFLALVRYLLQHRVRVETLGLLFGLAVAFLAMALAGVGLAVDRGAVPATLAFGGVMAVVMGVEAAYLIRRFYTGPPGRPWLARPSDGTDPVAPARAPIEARPVEAGGALR
jgi:hypothetical protein